MEPTRGDLRALIESARDALRAAALDADQPSLGVLTLAVLALHGRVCRTLRQLPDVFGDDVPWQSIGRDSYVVGIESALASQRSRITALARLHDRGALLSHCRFSLQTLGVVARDLQWLQAPSLAPAAAS